MHTLFFMHESLNDQKYTNTTTTTMRSKQGHKAERDRNKRHK